jgi:hypothetical protein
MTRQWGVRPTKACLDDLGIKPPSADIRLHEIEDPPLPAAQSLPDAFEAGGVKRIISLKDRVWFKLKTGRWRGAVLRMTDHDLATESDHWANLALDARGRWWLARVGIREDGNRRDFYEQITADSSCSRTPAKSDGVDTDHLLPTAWDRKRLALENAWAQRHVYEQVMLEAAAKSLRSGKVVVATFSTFTMGVVIRADKRNQCVAFIAENVFDPTTLAVMMDAFPGISANDWAPEPNDAFGITPKPGQIIYSTPLPTEVADEILERVPWSAD